MHDLTSLRDSAESTPDPASPDFQGRRFFLRQQQNLSRMQCASPDVLPSSANGQQITSEPLKYQPDAGLLRPDTECDISQNCAMILKKQNKTKARLCPGPEDLTGYRNYITAQKGKNLSITGQIFRSLLFLTSSFDSYSWYCLDMLFEGGTNLHI